jgi:hypothetical protein
MIKPHPSGGNNAVCFVPDVRTHYGGSGSQVAAPALVAAETTTVGCRLVVALLDAAIGSVPMPAHDQRY